MPETGITILTVAVLTPCIGIIVWFLVSIKKSFDKFNNLDKHIQNKLLLIEYYMIFVRNLSKEELILVGSLSAEEIIGFNKIHDSNERIKTARGKIKGKNGGC
ncbi:MAG: hypothetical protein LBU21_10650 [Treponema sp.]|jgi:hypothetical protein|nr:hypothetical protein [Treponema sp.]